MAAAVGAWAGDPVADPRGLYAVIALTGLAMGVRNSVVRKLAERDLTTTVLTLTIAGLAADSSLAGGTNPGWQRRTLSVVLLFGGAATGASLLRYSVAAPLATSAVASGGCAIAVHLAGLHRTAALASLALRDWRSIPGRSTIHFSRSSSSFVVRRASG